MRNTVILVLLVLVFALLLVLDDVWLHAQARKRRDRKR